MRTLLLCLVTAVLAAVPAHAARKTESGPPVPRFDPKTFGDIVDNPYFPLRPGTIYVYETAGGDSTTRDTVVVTHEIRTIAGVAAIAVRDSAWRGPRLLRVTTRWYAQDRKGNVWCLGVREQALHQDKLSSSEASWEAGRDSARAGIVMLATPQPGDRYRQEFYRGIAEDVSQVLNVNATTRVLNQSYNACVETEDTSTLVPGVDVRRTYAPGLGLVLERPMQGGLVTKTLIKVIVPQPE